MTNELHQFLTALETAGGKPKQSGPREYRCTCPAHGGDNPEALSIRQTDNGLALKCHTSDCTTAEICAAVGLTPRDLFPESNKPAQLPAVTSKPARTYETPELAADAILSRLGMAGARLNAVHTYRDADGQEYAAVLRFEGAAGADGKPEKSFRPIHKTPGGWALGDPARWYPFNVESLAAFPDSPVWIAEGEKATAAGIAMGRLIVTAAHGAKSPHKTDWGAFMERTGRGRDVILCPDNDEAGRGFAAKVAEILRGLGCKVKILDLTTVCPALPAKGDLADLAALMPDMTLAEIGRELQAAAEALDAPAEGLDTGDDLRTELEATLTPVDLPDFSADYAAELEATLAGAGGGDPVEPDQTPAGEQPEALQWTPPPLADSCDPALAYVIEKYAAAIGCDPGFAAPVALATIGGALGGALQLELKRKWLTPAALWVGIVAESGAKKSPILAAITAPLQEIQNQETEAWLAERVKHDAAVKTYQKELAIWRQEKNTHAPPPSDPIPPIHRRIVLDDCTLEKLAHVLHDNPAGVLVCRDELSAWLGGFGRYSGAADAEIGQWLALDGGKPLRVSRVKGDDIFVPRAVAGVVGGIQPQVLRRAVEGPLVECGLLARFIVTMPPRTSNAWRDDEIPEDAERIWAEALRRLYQLRSGDPVTFPLRGDAREVWKQEQNAYALLDRDLHGPELALWSKTLGNAARLVVIFHGWQWAVGNTAALGEVDAETVRQAWRWALWAFAEGRRTYRAIGLIGGTVKPRRDDPQALAAKIRAMGGSVTVRELARKWPRLYPDAEAARHALDALVIAGWARFVPEPAAKPGRPTERYELKADSAGGGA